MAMAIQGAAQGLGGPHLAQMRERMAGADRSHFGSGQFSDKAASKIMEKADGNGDSMLSLEEMSAQGQKMAEKRGVEFDAAKMEERFASMDGDGDGQLSHGELSSGLQSEIRGALSSLQFNPELMQGMRSQGMSQSRGAAAYQQQMDVIMSLTDEAQ